MTRRSILAAFCALWAAPALAQAPITLRLSQFLGPQSFFARDFARPWARELEAATNGRVRVELLDATSAYGDVTKQAAQVAAGTVDIALGLRGAEPARFPCTAVAELPFVVRDALSGSRALWAIHQRRQLCGEWDGFKVLALFVHNPGLIHTATKPVTVPADMPGLRFRAPNQAVAAALRAVGATPVILQVNDVMPALAAGRIDGIVTNWGNPLPDFDGHMHYHTAVQFYSSVFFVVMNKQRFASLPPDVQAAIDKLSGAALVDRFAHLWDKWDQPVRDGATGPGQQIITPDAAQMALWQAALRPVADRYIAALPAGHAADGRRIYDALIGKPQGNARMR